jgi:hypothetical protein
MIGKRFQLLDTISTGKTLPGLVNRRSIQHVEGGEISLCMFLEYDDHEFHIFILLEHTALLF